jgi:nucleoside-diphosphate-sugar epimerase
MEDPTTKTIVAKSLATLLTSHTTKTVIYTSGLWVYGDTFGKPPAEETTPINPMPLVSSRNAVEEIYLRAGGIVVRPGCMYGGPGSLTAIFFQGITEGKATFAGNDRTTWTTVHVDDSAEAYLLLAKSVRRHKFDCIGDILLTLCNPLL